MKRRGYLILSSLLVGVLFVFVGSKLVSLPTSAAARMDERAVPQHKAMTTLVTGNIGGYTEDVETVALAVEANGRIHVLWTGKLNPNFGDFVFYSNSTDGINWTPYQVLDHWDSMAPTIAIDDVHHRAHLVYSNLYDGIIHRVVTNGILGDPVVAVPRREYYQAGFPLPSGGLSAPDIAIAKDSGIAHLVWQEGYYQYIDGIYPYRRRSWYATWENGAGWSSPLQKINDLDTAYTSIEAAPDGRMMMAWFQRWDQSAGAGAGPGDPIVPRTAYGAAPGKFPLRQAAHELYSEPERDESIVMAYAAADDAFVLATDHFMWPGHSRVYRYVWKDGTWSEPLSVAENSSGWATPVHVGAAADVAKINYIYTDNWALKLRTETSGALGAAQSMGDYLAARGYSGALGGYFTDKGGGLHLVASGKNGEAGFYYVAP